MTEGETPVSPITRSSIDFGWGPFGDPVPPQIIEIHDDGSRTMVCWNNRGPYRTVRVRQNGTVVEEER